MTIKGTTYETIIDIERLIIVCEARLELYELEFKTYTLQRLKVQADETAVKMNIQENFLNKLKERRDMLYEQIDKLSNDLNDIEYNIFKEKFIYGTSNGDIQSKLSIEKTCYHKHLNRIIDVLQTTPYGELITETLKEE